MNEKLFDGLSGGPDISPPDIETLRRYKLLWNDGRPMKPVHCGISTVWATAIRDDEPVYAIFEAGTNRLVILERLGSEWREVQLNEVENLYGLLWQMCVAWSLKRML